jgi:hypothetical protein
MFPRVKQVRYLGDYCLELSFTDGVVGELDFKARVVGLVACLPRWKR